MVHEHTVLRVLYNLLLYNKLPVRWFNVCIYIYITVTFYYYFLFIHVIQGPTCSLIVDSAHCVVYKKNNIFVIFFIIS